MITMPMMMAEGRAKEEGWEITVNTEASTAGAKITGIPISLHNQPGITMTVDWGDGTESVLTQASYTEGDYTPSTHEYANPGTYTVQMKITDWKGVYIDTLSILSTGGLTHLAAFRDTLVIVGQLPGIKGTSYRSSSTALGSLQNNSFSYCFYGCSSLTSIPAGLFANNTAATAFNSCFSSCSSLTSIPAGLFANNTAATAFNGCFRDCSGLTSLPEGLFDSNTAATDFTRCFYGCSSLTSIPAGLFANNTAVTTFSYCFRGCSGLTSLPEGLFDSNTAATAFSYCFRDCSGLTSLPEGLFDSNTAAMAFNGCFYRCSSLTDFTLKITSSLVSIVSNFVIIKSGTTRIIYVPAGSTTETTFNSVADSLGLTIIGE